MKRMFGLAISIVVVVSLTHSGNVRNSSMYAAPQAASGKRVIEQLFAGWNSHDPDKVVAAFTEDVVYEDVTAGHISRGRAEARKWAEGAFAVIESFKIEVVSSSFHNGRGVVEWVWSGTDKGLLKTGKNFSVRGVSVFEVRRGKISRYKEFYDFSTIMRQVGLLPAEKRVDRAGTEVAFFENLKKLCGQQFTGETVFPQDENHPLAGKKLVMSVETCREKEIRIPFHVGEDKSRTWVLTLTDAGLLFKHDHRHADGTPDAITMYGGLAAPSGTQHMQSFPADAETAKLIPEAATNVWTLQINPEKQQFTYYLERQKQPRYKALFNLKALSK